MTAVTILLSAAMVAIGVALIVVGIDRADAVRVVVGVLFVAAGAGRIHLQRSGR